MLGGKKEEARSVPVYTVPTVDRPYEIVGTVKFQHGLARNPDPLFELGKKGAEIGADAVIALVASYGSSTAIFIGTAIRYKD